MTCHSDRETWSARGYEATMRRDPDGRFTVKLRCGLRGLLYAGRHRDRASAEADFEAIKQGVGARRFREVNLP